MENGFKRIKKIAKRVLPQIAETRMSSTSTNVNSVVSTMGNDALSEFVISPDMKHSPSIEDIVTDGNNFTCQFFDSDDEDCSDDSENVIEASTSFLSSMKDLEGIDPETRARLQVLFEAAGLVKTNPSDGGLVANQKLIRKLTSSVSEALDEAASALIKMKEEQAMERDESILLNHPEKNTEAVAQQLLKQHGSSLGKTTEDGESLLSMAASSGYYELCQVLLATNADVDDKGTKGDCTPLMEAAAGGFVDIIQLLLHNKACVNAKSTAGNTALHYAASGGHKKAVQILINAGAHVEAANENGHTPLMEAASVGHVGVAKLLIENGAEVNAQSREFKESALTLACYKGHTDIVQYLLNAGADLEHKTDEMHTALMEACIDGFVEVAKLLIERGAEVNMIPESYESPLTLAACGGHTELASLLISKGAIVDQRNDEGYTPLMEAAREGHDEVSKLLLEHGSDVNAITQESKETALTLACCSGFLQMADLLLRKGADLELGGLSPLIEAAQEGHLNLVKYLLSIGANVNAVSQRGDTALSCACGNGHTNVAEVLLKAGSNLEHVSNNGRTPLMKAAKMGHLLTVQFLVRKGAVINKNTPDNEYTALSLACIGGHLKVVEFLLQCGADASHKLKDGSTMLIEAAKGGHAQIVNLLLDWSTMLSSNSSLSEKLKSDLWRLSSKEQVGKKSHLKKALMKLEEMPKHLGYAEGEVTECPDKCCARTVRKQTFQNMEAMRSLIAQMDEEGARILSSPTKRSAPLPRESEPSKNKILQKEFESLKEAIRHDGDGCSGGIDSAVHDLSGSSSVSPSSSSSSSSSASEVEKFEDACFCCCTSEKPEASIERRESIASIVESRKRACLDHFNESDSAFGLKGGAAHEAVSPQSLHDPCDVSPTTLQNRIIAKGHRKLPQQPKVVSPQQKCQSSVVPPCLTETEKSLNKQKQINKPEVIPIMGDVFSLPKSQRLIDSCQERMAEMLFRNKHLDIQKAKNPESIHVQIKNLGSKTIDKAVSTLMNNPSKISVSRTKNSNLEKLIVNVKGSQTTGQKTDGNTTTEKPSTVSSSREHSVFPAIEVNAKTEANHDTALTLASAGGHFELVQLLLKRGADVEHRDKKGFTSLILAAAAGHLQVVNVLLEHRADTEAQLEQTKDTALSLACSGGRQEIAEALLKQGANREHRNASDYTPLCLAASAGHVNIVRLLLIHGAEINSRTSSRLGISPLMLASMNGHTAVVSLLLDMGGDVNAQIETNKNTALTLACFQGKHEVVALLVDRKANLEHRAKKGLTPLMEAASGGYVEVGRVLLDRGADVSALHGSSTRDTALTIASDRGHYRFVELLLSKGAPVDARNKKGHTALWLACNGGHLEVIQLLIKHKADPDSCDIRRNSCLMASFKKGHVKVVKWLVRRITQLPSDQDCARCISQIGLDKELLKKGQQCMEIIISVKERQAAEANKHANNLLLELALEQSLVESKKAAALRKREKRKQKKVTKKDSDKTSTDQMDQFAVHDEKLELSTPEEISDATSCYSKMCEPHDIMLQLKDEISSLGSVDSNINLIHKKHTFSESKSDSNSLNSTSDNELGSTRSNSSENIKNEVTHQISINPQAKVNASGISDLDDFSLEKDMFKLAIKPGRQNKPSNVTSNNVISEKVGTAKSNPRVVVNKACPVVQIKQQNVHSHKVKESDWKEVSRKCRKLNVPGKCISRIIGRGGCNINAVREASGAHIDLDKLKNSDDGVITIKGSLEASQLAMKLLESLIEDPDKDIEQLIPFLKGGFNKASKQQLVTSSSDVSKEIVKPSQDVASCVSTPRIPVTKFQESKDKMHITGNLSSKSQSPINSNLNGCGPWSNTKNVVAKAPTDFHNDRNENADEHLAFKEKILCLDALNSPTPGQYSDENFKNISSNQQHLERPISNSSSSYNFIGGGEFSPFDNLLSKITEKILKNKDQKKDFASVAAGSCLSSGSTMLPNSSCKLVTPEIDSELQAKAPGFRRGIQSQKNMQINASPSLIAEVPYSASLVARRLDFRNGEEIGTSPVRSENLEESKTSKSFNPGVIGSGIPSFNNNIKKNNYKNENDLKFSAAIGSNLNPNAPNFTSSMVQKQYDHSFSYPPLSQPFSLSTPSRVSNVGFDSLADNEQSSTFSSSTRGPSSSFMFDYGPGNDLWKFSSKESNGLSDFTDNSSKFNFPRYPSAEYISGSNFPTSSENTYLKQPCMFQDSYFNSINGSAFIDGIFPTQPGMTDSFASPLFSAFSSEAAYNQNTQDHFSSVGSLPAHPSGSYNQSTASAANHFTNSFGIPPTQTYSPLLHGWQQLNS